MKRVYSINIGQMNMKNIWIIRIAACLLLLSVSTSVFAQEFKQNWEKKVFAAYNLGGGQVRFLFQLKSVKSTIGNPDLAAL